MKLFLTSYRIPTPQALYDLVGKQPADINVAVVPNAGDYYIERARRFKIQDTIDYFMELGMQATVLDLADIKSADDIVETLQEKDLVWLSGGNTFMLMDQIKRSGFDTVIRELLENGLVYGGESAGALVAGNSLKGVEYADDPRFIDGEQWEGMNLIDNFVLPHVGSPLFADSIDKAKADHVDDGTMIELSDQQMLVVDGDRTEVLTGEKQ